MLIKKYKFELILLLVLIINFFLIFHIFGFNFGGDEFVGPTRYIVGEEGGAINRQTILRPLAPLVAAIFTPFMNVYQAFFLLDLIFYLITPFVVFYFAVYFFGNKKQALYAGLIYSSAYPYLTSTLNYMSDCMTWFFLIFSLFLTLKYLKVKSNFLLYINPVVCFLGFMVKENGGLGIIFIGLVLLFMTDLSWRQKIKKLILVGLIFIMLIVAYQLFITLKFHDNFFQFTKWAHQDYGDRSNYSLLSITKKATAMFGIAWVYVLLGIYKLFKNKEKYKLIILSMLVPGSLMFLIWPYQVERLMYTAAPLLVLLAAYGITWKKLDLRYCFIESGLVIIFIILSYSTKHLIANYNLF